MTQASATQHPDVIHQGGEPWMSPTASVVGAAMIVATITRDTVPPEVADLLDILASACFRFIGEHALDDEDVCYAPADVLAWVDGVGGEGTRDASLEWFRENGQRLIRTGFVCDVAGASCDAGA